MSLRLVKMRFMSRVSGMEHATEKKELTRETEFWIREERMRVADCRAPGIISRTRVGLND